MSTIEKIISFAERVNFNYKKVHNRLVLCGYVPSFIYGNKEIGEETYYKPNEDSITLKFSYLQENNYKIPNEVIEITD